MIEIDEETAEQLAYLGYEFWKWGEEKNLHDRCPCTAVNIKEYREDIKRPSPPIPQEIIEKFKKVRAKQKLKK